jgi:hypothetical protein
MSSYSGLGYHGIEMDIRPVGRSRRSIGTYDHRPVVTSIKSETMAQQRAEAAIVTAFTPICVDKFRAAPDADAKLTELMKVSSWSKATFVKDGGWAMVGTESNYRVADASLIFWRRNPESNRVRVERKPSPVPAWSVNLVFRNAKPAHVDRDCCGRGARFCLHSGHRPRSSPRLG